MAFRGNTVHYVLFFLTVLTTIWCGSIFFQGSILSGVLFSFTIMAILLVHEMGHYLNAKWHGIKVTLPYFIPIPMGIGTFGAFIRMGSRVHNRNVLIDVGASGPLYGFVAAVLAVALGLDLASVCDKPVSHMFGVSLLYYTMANMIQGVSPEYLEMNPVLFAGWLGLFVTMINLLPLGQLDGGHVIYALFGRGKNYQKNMVRFFFMLFIWGFLSLYIYHNLTWLFFGFLICFMGSVIHPPLDNEMIDLTVWSRVRGWTCIVIFVLTFTPAPFMP